MIKDFSHEVRQLEHEARMLPKILNGIGDPVFQKQVITIITQAVEFLPDDDAMTFAIKGALAGEKPLLVVQPRKTESVPKET